MGQSSVSAEFDTPREAAGLGGSAGEHSSN